MGFLSGDDDDKAEVRETRRSQSNRDLREEKRILCKRRSLVCLKNLEKRVGRYEVVEG